MPSPKSKIVRLRDTGYLTPLEASERPAETPSYLDRPVMIVYTGEFDSMDGKVKVTDEDIDRLIEHRNSILSKAVRMASGEPHVLAQPPMQLDHSVSAAHTIGRVIGEFKAGTHEPKPGDVRKALFSVTRFLGRDNVEKAMDGRYLHVSLGADLKKGTFQELSVTPFPAASDASLLSQGDTMLARLKSYLMRTMKLSAEDADKKLAEMPDADKAKMADAEKSEHEKLKKYLTGHKKMADADADKHLAELPDEKKKELSAEADEHEKKLAATPPPAAETEEHKAKMTAARESIAKLSTDFRSSAQSAQLAQKKAGILTHLSRLRAEAKITPAEVKKIDLAKLAGENEATIDAVLKSYSDREPVILVGVSGSKVGVNFSQAQKVVQMSALEAETRANMPFMAQADKNRLSAESPDGGAPRQPLQPSPAQSHAGAAEVMTPEQQKESHEQAAAHMAKVHAAMDAGKMDEAKEHLKRLMEHCMKHMRHPAHMSEGAEHQTQAGVEMSALADSVKTMQNKFNELTALVGTIVGDGK